MPFSTHLEESHLFARVLRTVKAQFVTERSERKQPARHLTAENLEATAAATELSAKLVVLAVEAAAVVVVIETWRSWKADGWWMEAGRMLVK